MGVRERLVPPATILRLACYLRIEERELEAAGLEAGELN
jgi:hypothetical protein